MYNPFTDANKFILCHKTNSSTCHDSACRFFRHFYQSLQKQGYLRTHTDWWSGVLFPAGAGICHFATRSRTSFSCRRRIHRAKLTTAHLRRVSKLRTRSYIFTPPHVVSSSSVA